MIDHLKYNPLNTNILVVALKQTFGLNAKKWVKRIHVSSYTWMVAMCPSSRMISPTSSSYPTLTNSYMAAPDIFSAVTTAAHHSFKQIVLLIFGVITPCNIKHNLLFKFFIFSLEYRSTHHMCSIFQVIQLFFPSFQSLFAT